MIFATHGHGLTRRLCSAVLSFAVSRRLCSAAVRIDMGIASLPDPSKKRGEDAHIISRGSSTRTWAGVFDGVGGWSRHGIDPSKYSRELARIVDLELHRQVANGSKLNLRAALHGAATTNGEIGSCTACIASIDTDTSRVTTLNLGDSGVWVLRRTVESQFSLVHRSQVQQHAFNTPFQLGTQSRDSARDGELGTFAGRAGDLVLLATDGLFDNLSETLICSCVSETGSKPAQHIADTLAHIAQKLSFDPYHKSPFQLEAARHGIDFQGGKVDDTTVVVLKLCDDGGPEDAE
jgi:protein phosphatase PTC7